jgi:hypothetical protein
MQPSQEEFIPPEILQKIRDNPEIALNLEFFYKGGKEVVYQIAQQDGTSTKVFTQSLDMRRAWARKLYDPNFYVYAEVRVIRSNFVDSF